MLFKSSALVLLTMGALVMSAACLDDDRQAAQQLLGRLREPNGLEAGITTEETLKMLEKVAQLDGNNKEAEDLILAHKIGSSRCTAAHQKWLIRRMLENKNTPIGAYLANIRDQYRDLCSQNFKKRFLVAMLKLDVDVEYAIGDYLERLPESKQLERNLYSLDGVPLDSLVVALKGYLEDYAEQATNGRVLRDIYASQDHIGQALERLSEACEQLIDQFGDFVWLLKMIERPTEKLDKAAERLLWGTKVCQSLKFDHFERELAVRQAKVSWEERELLHKFTGLLRVPDAIVGDGMYRLQQKTLREALEKLVDERHYRTQSGREKFEIARELLDELEAACLKQLKETHNFVWLLDLDLKYGPNTADSKSSIKQTRVCALLPFVHFQS